MDQSIRLRPPGQAAAGDQAGDPGDQAGTADGDGRPQA